MEKISGYDVVLTFSPIDEITGHVFEVFDYYLFLRDRFRCCMLFLGNMTETDLETAFRSKYVVDFDDVRKDLVYYSKESLRTRNSFSFDRDTVVILTDGNVHALQVYGIRLMTRKLYGFLCYSHEMLLGNPLSSMYRHITYLQDYRVYGRNGNFSSVDYVKKLPFRFYRKSEREFDNTGMMYVTYACRKVSPQVISEYHQMSGCSHTLLVVPYALPEYGHIDGVEQVVAPVRDFFDRFDTYIYTPVHRRFDCSPRLVTECFMQGKKVFLHLDYMDIGLKTRYDDCVERLDSLNLVDGDGIVDVIESARKAP